MARETKSATLQENENEQIAQNLEQINETQQKREFWRSYAKTDVAI